MAFVTFNKALDSGAPDDLRINTLAVLYVEASRPDLLGQTTIHMLGQGAVFHAVTEPVGLVISLIGGLVPATRYYLASPPESGPSTVYISPATVSYLMPNLPGEADFWYVKFVDGSELRVMAPLPAGL